MKTVYTSIFAILAATPALAGSLETPIAPAAMHAPMAAATSGGYVTANFEYTAANDEGDYGSDDAFSAYGVELAYGSAGNSGFGWQVDAQKSIGTHRWWRVF